MSSRARVFTVGILAAWLGAVVMAPANAAVIETNFVSSADTTLFEFIPDNNLGDTTTMISGTNARGFKNRALLRFDLDGKLPAGAVIVDAWLVIQVNNSSAAVGANAGYTLHRVLKPWNEGKKTGNQGARAAADEVTWNSTGVLSPAKWTTPGTAAPEDFVEASSAASAVTDLGPVEFGGDATLVADVRLWLANSATNFGWLILGEDEDVPQSSRRIATREDPESAPRLFIQYEAPVAELRIGDFGVSGGNFVLRLDLKAATRYVIQGKDSLADLNWQVLTNIAPAVADRRFEFSDALGAGRQRYYRYGTAP
jgi:hypothetical protein